MTLAINDNKNIKHVLFQIDEHYFALTSEHIIDIINHNKITNVPLASNFVLGLHDLRGRIVTCLDTRIILGLNPTDISKPNMLIVIKNGDEDYSLTVDHIISITELDIDNIKTNPGNLKNAWDEISSGLYSQDGHLYLILNHAKLIDKIVA